MWMFNTYCESDTKLLGKSAVITGGNSGIGKETAKELYKRGARVIIACRNLEKGRKAIAEIVKECEDIEKHGEIIMKYLDLTDLSTVKSCAKDILESEPKIHLLINNAGAFFAPERYIKDGLETYFMVNYLGHFLLTILLLPRMIESGLARIVNVASLEHMRGTIDFNDIHFKNRLHFHIYPYSQSKLAIVLFTKELARRLEVEKIKNVTTYCLHPGVVNSELGRNVRDFFPGLRFIWPFCQFMASLAFMTTKQGAQTTLHCALDDKAGTESGLYYRNCKAVEPAPNAFDEVTAKKLWDVSLEMAGLKTNYDPFKTIKT